MRARERAVLRKSLVKRTRTQRPRLVAEWTAEECPFASVAVIENASAHRACPHCGAERIVKNGPADGGQRFKCRACAKTFNVLTGPPLAHLHQRGKWLEQATAIRDGLSLTQAIQRRNVARTTALRGQHRFLAAPKTVQAHVLNGMAETDETFFRHSCKGQRGGLSRKARKRGTSKEQVPVRVARDRSGATADFILDVDDASPVVAALKPILPPDAILCTDSSRTLIAAALTLDVEHHSVNLAAGVRVDSPWHVQNVNAYDSRLKGWLRHFHGVSTRYLDSYLGWFRDLERSPGKTLQPAPFLDSAVMA